MTTITRSHERPAGNASSPRGCAELQRLLEADRGEAPWRRWGPYLSDRQWATVREDYSPEGNCWDSFPHDHARSRAYRWGEDGLLGICDDDGRLNFALALWNGRDPILKERLFGLAGPEGNHGEDVKEAYFHLDSTPTHAYMRALYKYPQAEFPYGPLVEENRRRGRDQPEYELADTGVFDEGRYFDVEVQYAKAAPEDLLIRILITNRGPERAEVHVLPTIWFRNEWSWDHPAQSSTPPSLRAGAPSAIAASHPSLGEYELLLAPGPDGGKPDLLFTENETNARRLWGVENPSPYVKDAFHERVVHGRVDAVNPDLRGTKAAAWYRLVVGAGQTIELRLRLRRHDTPCRDPFGKGFEGIFEQRRREADEFYAVKGHSRLTTIRASRVIPTGGTCCTSTSISTARPAADLGPRTRPGGPHW